MENSRRETTQRFEKLTTQEAYDCMNDKDMAITPVTSDTYSMIACIQHSIHKYTLTSELEKATLNKRSRDSTIADFVFSVTQIEGEGLDSLHQTQQLLWRLAERFDFAGLESSDATNKALLLWEKSNSFDVKSRATYNMYKATQECLQRCHASKQPTLDIFFIKHLHEILYSNTEDWHEAGNYRKCSAFTVTSTGETFSYLSFCKIPIGLNRLIESTNTSLQQIFKSDDDNEARLLNLLKLGGVFFLQFETIHPFHDGNGRVGRLLLAYLLSSLTPFGLNPFYVESARFPVFVDRCVYLKCFEDDARDSSSIMALIIEGIYLSWKNYFQHGN